MNKSNERNDRSQSFYFSKIKLCVPTSFPRLFLMFRNIQIAILNILETFIMICISYTYLHYYYYF